MLCALRAQIELTDFSGKNNLNRQWQKPVFLRQYYFWACPDSIVLAWMSSSFIKQLFVILKYRKLSLFFCLFICCLLCFFPASLSLSLSFT